MNPSCVRLFLLRLTAACLLLLLTPFPVAARTFEAALPGELPEALEGLDIRGAYVPAGSFARAGVVHALQGTLVVVHRADRTAFAASQGDPIHENDELFTLKDSRCRIRFRTDDVVNIAPETRFSVERFMDRPEQGEKTSLFRMIKGKAMFYALRLFRYREARFQVETPTAVMGVRGTQFGVHVFWLENDRAQGEGVRVADRGDGFPSTSLAQAGGTRQSGTIVACGDGQLDVTDPVTGEQLALVNPSEDFNTVTGEKVFDPLNRTLNGIARDTRVKGEDDGQGGEGVGGPDQDGALSGTGGDDSSAAPVDVTDLTTDVTTQQTGDETEKKGSAPSDFPSSRYGYFNGLLTADNGLGGYYRVVDLADFNDTVIVQGRRLGATVGWMQVKGSGGTSAPRITGLIHDGKTVDSGLPADMKWYRYGHNSWMVWGVWRQPDPMHTSDGGGDNFTFDYRGYYFAGDYTTNLQMAVLQHVLGTVTYTGDAWGKHRDLPAGTEMTGQFRATVNFGTPSIEDFDLAVAGGGHNAVIANAKGSFSGSSSQFVMDTGTGVWRIDGNPGTHMDARGSLYGKLAQGFGANWVITDGTSSAWGMCVGGR